MLVSMCGSGRGERPKKRRRTSKDKRGQKGGKKNT